MYKRFCDFCKQEIKDNKDITITVNTLFGGVSKLNICAECIKKTGILKVIEEKCNY